MSSDSTKCQVCGSFFTQDAILDHELSCLVNSEEELDANAHKAENASVNDDNTTGESVNTSPNPHSDLDDGENNFEQNSASGSGIPEACTSCGLVDNHDEVLINSPHFEQRRRSSLVTPTFRYDREKPENLFPPTKKYRYYPVTCDYCGKRFQPNKLKAHQKKHHLSGTDEVKPAKKVQSEAIAKESKKQSSSSKSKSVGGIPRQLQVCYICGQMYGSKSLKIHEPQCLKKWRIQNEELPPDLRAPEPVKPEPQASIATGKDVYDIPKFDPAAEAAFKSHLSTLIACKHCSRTFSPDRIQKHMSCCIERPRTSIRECTTPKGGEISR